MNATFYTVSKRRNSTKQGTGGGSYTVTLKDSCSVLAPRLALKWSGTGTPRAYNQCYIGDFGRYYWVDDWTFQDRQWIANCSVDVLATMKTEIGSSAKLVARSASKYDGHVSDSVRAVKMDPLTYNLDLNCYFDTSLAYGKYVIGIIGQNNTFSAGGSGYIVCNASKLQDIINACFTETANTWSVSSLGSSVGEVFANYGENLMKSIQNPSQFITSITWIPVPVATSGQTSVRLGQVDTNIIVDCLSNPISTKTFNCLGIIPYTIDSDTERWRYMEPFRRYMLVCPPFGSFPLNGAQMIEQLGNLYGSITVDCITGQAILEVPKFGISSAAQLGIPIKLSGAMTDYAGATISALNTVSSASAAPGRLLGGALTGGIGGAASAAVGALADVGTGVINTLAAVQPQAVQGSIGGGLAALNAARYVNVIEYGHTDIDEPGMGRPLMNLEVISTLSGFIQCADGDVEGPYTPEELEACSAFLLGGFYYE